MRPKKEECVIIAYVIMISVSSVTIVLCIAIHFTLYLYPAFLHFFLPQQGIWEYFNATSKRAIWGPLEANCHGALVRSTLSIL